MESIMHKIEWVGSPIHNDTPGFMEYTLCV